MTAGIRNIHDLAQAHWLSINTLTWPVPFGTEAQYYLHYDAEGTIRLEDHGLVGGNKIPLSPTNERLPDKLKEMFPHLADHFVLRLDQKYTGAVPEILKGQTVISASAADGGLYTATALQIPGVLDDLYANDEALGVTFDSSTPILRLWAPTARKVKLVLYDGPQDSAAYQMLPMIWEPQNGTWRIKGLPEWKGKYYLYQIDVYVRQERGFVQNLVTDPYSVCLSANSKRSQLIDLSDQALKPAGWERLAKPPLEAPEDITLYELHIRDFSARDEAIPESVRGSFLAFAHPASSGMKHLRRLANAGLTHIHLLPAADFATVNERRDEWASINAEQLANQPPNSEDQQAMVSSIRDRDGYNWGYDPYHYSTPEGSYSSNPDGTARIIEFRKMVQAINEAGLRVVMDVVYNHTYASGQQPESVLDKIVPGYYHRLDENGNITNSTCCANTASEHKMMEKLMVDSILLWAKEYRVDGFRFDLMGHHMVTNMVKIRQALNSLTREVDGVEGETIYLYGEGWNFGEAANGARGLNANQINLAGTGIGTFNDRMRDAVRGGNPFSSPQEQGFGTGLFIEPNEIIHLSLESQRASLLEYSDLIRISLAGNLAMYKFTSAHGLKVSGAEIGYNYGPAGYAHDPQENVVYVEAHDNETFFDSMAYKVALAASMDERVRIQNMTISLLALSQGIPFFHAGMEILRSKSMDRDSYNSGDWFNRLDYTYATNNWGVGMPPRDKNINNYPLIEPLLERAELKPEPKHIHTNLEHFLEMLQIRRSSPLFRLRTADEVCERVTFHNTGTAQIPGLIVMAIADGKGELDLDYKNDLILTFFNTRKDTIEFTMHSLEEAELRLHPIQRVSTDLIVRAAEFYPKSKSFHIPPRTTAVFWGNGYCRETPVISSVRKNNH